MKKINVEFALTIRGWMFFLAYVWCFIAHICAVQTMQQMYE